MFFTAIQCILKKSFCRGNRNSVLQLCYVETKLGISLKGNKVFILKETSSNIAAVTASNIWERIINMILVG